MKEKDTSMRDPVCGMEVDPSTAAASAEHAGTTFFFCSHHCHRRFVADPAAYVAASRAEEGPMNQKDTSHVHDHAAASAPASHHAGMHMGMCLAMIGVVLVARNVLGIGSGALGLVVGVLIIGCLLVPLGVRILGRRTERDVAAAAAPTAAPGSAPAHDHGHHCGACSREE